MLSKAVGISYDAKSKEHSCVIEKHMRDMEGA
jgi:hypothetical protein